MLALAPFWVVVALLATPPLPRVVVLGSEQAPARPAFVEALRIQVMSAAAVAGGGLLKSNTLAERLDEAARIVDDEQAAVAVWVEEAPSKTQSGRDYVVYAVGKERDRALVEVARLRADEGPDVDRALALKVGAFLDSLMAARAAEVEVTRAFARTSTVAAPEIPPVPAHSGATLRFAGEAGAVAVLNGDSNGAQEGLAVAAGARAGWAGWCLEPYGLLRLLTDFDVSNGAGHLIVHEKMVGLGARGILLGDPWAAGVYVEAAARILGADGTSPAGRVGDAHRTIPAFLAGIEARRALGGSLALRGAVGVQIDTVRQSFSIDGARVSDLGRLRPTASLTLVFSAP